MTDEQEARWWDAVDDGARLFVHALLILLTWPAWLVGKFTQAMSASGQDPKGLEAKPASAVAESDAPNSLNPRGTPTAPSTEDTSTPPRSAVDEPGTGEG